KITINDQNKKILVNAQKTNILKRLALPHAIESAAQKEITVIAGVRRCGKSTLLMQVISALRAAGVDTNNILYLNFEDERLVGFGHEDFQKLNEIFLAGSTGKKAYMFLDEIQNIQMWEKWANRMYEFENVKLFVTGSNSSLLKSDVSSALTGRSVTLYEFPLSFKELCGKMEFTTEGVGIALAKLDQYMEFGGFPEVVLGKRKDLLLVYLRDIIERDIIRRHNIRNRKRFEEFAFYIMNLYAKRFTFEKLKNIFNLGSINTAKKFVGYIEEAFLAFSVERFSNSMSEVVRAPRKLYVVDHALSQQISNNPLQDKGAIYENIVYLQLERACPADEKIYYWEDYKGREVDFIIKKGETQ
ncbi:ATPase, partial [mine drainage metagenome]